MKSIVDPVAFFDRARESVSIILATLLLATSLLAQRPAAPAAKPQPSREAAPKPPDPTFETLLGADTYKLYGEVRNLGQLLTGGGAGDIVDPIIKLAGPGQQFQDIVKFLKKNEEALATSRLLFASWRVRTDVPNAFVAIEFATPEEAMKFSPKLEKFLPTVLPPVTDEPEMATTLTDLKTNEAGKQNQQRSRKSPETETNKQTTNNATANSPNRGSSSPERLPFALSQRGNLIFISDQSFKFEKLHPASSKALVEDQNFRVAHDRFSNESVFLYFNVALEEKPQPTPPPPPKISEEEKARVRAEEESRRQKQLEKEAEPQNATVQLDEPKTNEMVPKGEVTVTKDPPTLKESMENAQLVASIQIGRMLETLGVGEPQWPEAVGAALTLDNNEYVLRAILIEPPERKKMPLPFVPQLLSGPAFASDVPSVLPDDTEVFVSASIDLAQTYEGMRKEAERKAKAEIGKPTFQRYEKGVLVEQGPPRQPSQVAPDPFAEFEKKSGFKIKDDLLPALGNEIAVAASLKSASSLGLFGAPAPKASPSPGDSNSSQNRTGGDVFPMLLIAIKDRDTARRLMPHVLDGLGIGEVNMIAQVEKHDDAEIVSYSGMLAYAFVGNFLVISEAPTVRHVVDAWSNRQTLSGNHVFRNFTRWQPHQTLGEIYVSPALMESYREQLTKQAPKMDPTLRDLLMSLSPAPQAISYSLSNEGFGAFHELHLPKDYVLAMVAQTSATMNSIKSGGADTNEMIAIGGMHMVFSAETSYAAGAGKGNYGSLDQLVAQKLLMPELFKQYGYNVEVTANGDHFEAVATPIEYGKTGRRSFFVDKTGVVRGDDRGGAPASAGDKAVEP